MEPRVTVVHELTLEFLADRWRERTKEVRRGGQKEEEGDACVRPILENECMLILRTGTCVCASVNVKSKAEDLQVHFFFISLLVPGLICQPSAERRYSAVRPCLLEAVYDGGVHSGAFDEMISCNICKRKKKKNLDTAEGEHYSRML